MIRAHTIRLNPTPEQESLFRQAAGTARFCYNWGLRIIKDALDRGEKLPHARALRDAFKRIRAAEYTWTFQVGKSAIEGAFVHLGNAVTNFFASRNGRRKGKRVGFPTFKSRRHGYGSFYVANDRLTVDGHTLTVSKVGTLNMTEFTTSLVRHASLVGIEDLNVAGMLKNHCLAQAISDVGFAEFRHQLDYKAPAAGSQVVAIGRFSPSSKTCNHCGSVNPNLTLAMREWTCPACGTVRDRDLNAALNIRDEAIRLAGA